MPTMSLGQCNLSTTFYLTLVEKIQKKIARALEIWRLKTVLLLSKYFSSANIFEIRHICLRFVMWVSLSVASRGMSRAISKGTFFNIIRQGVAFLKTALRKVSYLSFCLIILLVNQMSLLFFYERQIWMKFGTGKVIF